MAHKPLTSVDSGIELLLVCTNHVWHACEYGTRGVILWGRSRLLYVANIYIYSNMDDIKLYETRIHNIDLHNFIMMLRSGGSKRTSIRCCGGSASSFDAYTRVTTRRKCLSY